MLLASSIARSEDSSATRHGSGGSRGFDVGDGDGRKRIAGFGFHTQMAAFSRPAFSAVPSKTLRKG